MHTSFFYYLSLKIIIEHDNSQCDWFLLCESNRDNVEFVLVLSHSVPARIEKITSERNKIRPAAFDKKPALIQFHREWRFKANRNNSSSVRLSSGESNISRYVAGILQIVTQAFKCRECQSFKFHVFLLCCSAGWSCFRCHFRGFFSFPVQNRCNDKLHQTFSFYILHIFDKITIFRTYSTC